MVSGKVTKRVRDDVSCSKSIIDGFLGTAARIPIAPIGLSPRPATTGISTLLFYSVIIVFLCGFRFRIHSEVLISLVL